jgi:uncharacterized repeat protein (TIGR03943 family)
MIPVPRILSQVRNALILLLWGAGILWLDLSGRLSAYLHPSLQPFTAGSGFLLILLAGFSIMALATMQREQGHSCCCDHDGHEEVSHHPEKHADHHHGDAGALALFVKTVILAMPILVLLSGNADRFTATTVANRGVVQDLSNLPSANASAAKIAGNAAVPEASPVKTVGAMPLQVIDMLYALQMPSYREEFEGKEVEMIAQYVPMTTGNPKGDRFQAVRMFITCCAADAKPVGVTVRASSIPKLPEMGWVRITGKPAFPMEGGRRAAVLEASKVESCDAPSEPFVY